MKITPIEIRQKEFEKVFRGYEKEAVDSFLQSLSVEWERIMDDNKTFAKKIEANEKEIERLREVETSLFRTLKSAEETGNSLIEAANKKSELYVREAQMNAETMLTEARYKSKSMIEEAEERSKDIVATLLQDIRDIELSYHQIAQLKEDLLREVKHTVSDFNDKLMRYGDTMEEQKLFDAKVKHSKKSATEKPNRNTNSSETSPKSNPVSSNQEEDSSKQSDSFFDKL